MKRRTEDYEALLEHTGLSLLECVCLGKSLSEQRRSLKLPPQLSVVRDATLYAEALLNRRSARASISFREAVRLHIQRKRERRTRTRDECRSVLLRMIREVPGLGSRQGARHPCAQVPRGHRTGFFHPGHAGEGAPHSAQLL